MPTMDVTIEKLIYGGEGLAHHDGATVFVPFVLPAERVAVSSVEQKKKFVRARIEKVLVPSPARAVAPCPHFGACGGCDYQHIPYEAQLAFKTEILRETLRRLGHIEWNDPIASHAVQPFGYRNRAQWKFRTLSDESSASASGGSGGGNAFVPLSIGYFHPNSSALCSIRECPILSPALHKAFLAIREAAASAQFPRALREIEAFAAAPLDSSSESKLLLTATFAGFPSHAADLAKKFHEIVAGIESLVFHDPGRDRMELFGPGFVEHRAGGRSYRVGHFSFFQVNDSLVEELVRHACGRDDSGESCGLALDLFAGVGLFSLPLAERYGRVVAVESNPAAARDLEFNVRGRANVEVRSADVERFLEKFKESPDVALLDPPRAGLEPAALQRLVRLAPTRITYVSCEPPTLARDLAALVAGGYTISELDLFDLFPQTFHMEAIARLRRST